jgi:hypothetical protein
VNEVVRKDREEKMTNLSQIIGSAEGPVFKW